MKEELENKLYEKYPKIFVNRYASEQESCMAFGLEVGDGWYNLIEVLCEALTYTFTTSVRIDEEDGKRLGIKPTSWANDPTPTYYFSVEPPQVVADQVKEKFGELRFYYHLEYSKENISLIETKKYPSLEEVNKRYADYMDGIVHFATIASSRTCEVTGADGVMCVRKGWFKVINENLLKTERYEGYKPVSKRA